MLNMKFLLCLLTPLLLLAATAAQAQNSAKAKSKDRFREKVESPLPTEIIVVEAKTYAPLLGASVRILRATADGFVDGRRNLYELEVKQTETGAVTMNKKPSQLGSPDLWTNAAGRAWTEFSSASQYLVMVSLSGYVGQEQMFVPQGGGQLRFELRRQPACSIRASGTVLTEKYGHRVVGAQVRFVPDATGEATTVYTNLNGEFSACLPATGNYTAWVLCEGFQLSSFKCAAAPDAPAQNDVRLPATFPDATRQEIGFLSGTTAPEGMLLLDSLVFEPKSTSMSATAMRRLNELARIMLRYPKVMADFVAHTDVRGDAQMNQALSDERARNARDYLAVKGVPPHLLRISGKGEPEPRNTCLEGVPCSEAEHQQNSRFEVRRWAGGH